MIVALCIAVAFCLLLGRAWVRALRRESALEREIHRHRISLGLAPSILSLPLYDPRTDEGMERYREWAGIRRRP